MPIYEYRCEDCGEVTEGLRSMSSADEPIACEHCGSQKTQRVQSVFAASVAEGGGGSDPGPGACPGGMCSMPGGGCPFG